MSRIGVQPITIPAGVEIKVSEHNVVTVKGKLGEMEQKVDPAITVSLEDDQVSLDRKSELKQHKAMHGLYRSLINNMVIGVTEGYKIELELVGVGWRAEVKNGVLELTMGFSHHVFFQMPDIVKAEAITERGKNPQITLTCVDKQLVGQVAAKIRAMRKPEPYKGKGVKFKGEVLRRKAGKSAASA